MQTFARHAVSQDEDVLRLLETQARRSLTDFRGADRLASAIPAIGENWRQVLIDKQLLVLVGGIDLVVMGYLVARKSISVAESSTEKTATVEQVFVTHDARNLGVGDALVSATLDWANEQKLTALDALALPGDRETKNLYERSGLVARLITVTKKLG